MQYKELLDKLIEKNYTLSCMESLTGGLFASTFTSIPNASKVYNGGIVTYTNSAKKTFHIKEKTLDAFGAISKECANEMVIQASNIFSSDVSVSFTGNAGPTSSEDKEVGLVYIGIKITNKIEVYELHLKGDRDEIRKQCVDFAFTKLIEKIN